MLVKLMLRGGVGRDPQIQEIPEDIVGPLLLRKRENTDNVVSIFKFTVAVSILEHRYNLSVSPRTVLFVFSNLYVMDFSDGSAKICKGTEQFHTIF